MRTRWNFVIPARAGSRGVVGKNYQPVGGLPLICHNIDLVLGLPDELCRSVIVSTNDPMVGSLVKARYRDRVAVEERPERLASDTATIDELCLDYSLRPGFTPFCLIQPTTFGIDRDDLIAALTLVSGSGSAATAVVRRNQLDWVTGAAAATGGAAVTGVTHQPQRVNRQEMTSQVLTEVGVRLHPARFEGIEYRPFLFTRSDIIDIDTPEDLERARHRAERLTIRFYPVSSREQGMGHLYRVLALAERLQHHQIEISRAFVKQGAELCEPWSEIGTGPADVVVLDLLDTTPDQVMGAFRDGARGVVTLEDRGEGANYATATISDMYPSGQPRAVEYLGPEYTVLRPEFLAVDRPRTARPDLTRVLVTFGGTDPGEFTEKFGGYLADVLPTLGIEVGLIDPPGRTIGGGLEHRRPARMAELMSHADLVVTSAGRTLYEAAACGTPAIALSQNHRESKHLHLGEGNVYMGDGRRVSPFAVEHEIHGLADWGRRNELVQEAVRLVDRRGTERVAQIIEGAGREGRARE